MLASLTGYFERNPDARRRMHEIISGASPISLRLIDHFATHYTREKNVSYFIDTRPGHAQLVESPTPEQAGPNLKKVHLYLEYLAQLKSYTKVHFDPFRRHDRISFVLEKSPQVVMQTTVGQLNFFRWAFQMHVLDYIAAHLGEIETHMAGALRTPRSSQRPGPAAAAAAAAEAEADAKPPTRAGGKRGVIVQPLQVHPPVSCYVRFD